MSNPVVPSSTESHTVSLEAETEEQPDQVMSDDDSALGLSLADSTFSVSSSIFDYMEENGRRYHAFQSGKYMLPNDEREQDRLDLQHQSFRIMLDGKLHLAPVHKPRRVLDLATGTGIWAIEFAQENQNSVVIGTDLSPIQPDFVPVNCHFQVADAEEGWTFSEPFDFVHARAIVTCFKSNKAMAQKIFDNLAPGGYFELQDPTFPMRCDDGTYEGTALQEWNNHLISAMTMIGRNLCDSTNWAQHMHEAGFVDIVEHKFNVPMSPWSRGKKNRLLGAISMENLLEGVASMSTAPFTRVLGWSQARLEVFLVQVRNDLRNREVHVYDVVYLVTGRKPLA